MKSEQPTNESTTQSDTKIPESKRSTSLTKPKKLWLVPILLIVALFLPLIGEMLQVGAIGNEFVCCMPDNYEYLQKRAERAKTLRPYSNVIIAGSIIIGMLLTIGAMIYFYRSIRPIKTKSQLVFVIITTIIAAYIIAVLIRMLIYFCTNVDYYFQYRGMGVGLYEVQWYNPLRPWRY